MRMFMSQIKHSKIEEIPAVHRAEHEGFEYYRRKFVPFGGANNALVSVYEIPPGKAAYPYHYHHKNEETFYILSGEGILRTPDGEKKVAAGDLLFFPVGPAGAHKLTNCSETENLTYLDFDVVHDVDIAVYPDSDKIGIWGKGINKTYPCNSAVDYYEGE
jgi:uncharacterized cupin superfamily protein